MGEIPKTPETKGERTQLSPETMGTIRGYLSEYGNLCKEELDKIKKNPEEYAEKKGWSKGKTEEVIKELETRSKDLNLVPKNINNLSKESHRWIGSMLNQYIQQREIIKGKIDNAQIAKINIELIEAINNQPEPKLRKMLKEIEDLEKSYQSQQPNDPKRAKVAKSLLEKNHELRKEMGKIFELSPDEEKKAIEEIRKAGEEEKREVPPEGKKTEEEKGKIPEGEKKPETKTVRVKTGVEDYFANLVTKHVEEIIMKMGVRRISGETQITASYYLDQIYSEKLAELAKRYAQKNPKEIVENAGNMPLSTLFEKENEPFLIAAAQKSKEFMEMVRQNEEAQFLSSLREAWKKSDEVSVFAIAPVLNLMEGKRGKMEEDLRKMQEDLAGHFRNIEKIAKDPLLLKEYQKLAQKVQEKQMEFNKLEKAMKEMVQIITQTNLDDKNRSALLRDLTFYAEGLRDSQVLISRAGQLGLGAEELPREGWDKILRTKEARFKVWDSRTGQWEIILETDLKQKILSLYSEKRWSEITREEIKRTALLSPEQIRAFNENLKHALIKNWEREQLEKRIPSELKEFEKRIAEATGIDSKEGCNKTLKDISQEKITGVLKEDAPLIQNWIKKNFGIDDISVEDIITRGDSKAYEEAVKKDDIAILVWLIKTILELATPISRGER